MTRSIDFPTEPKFAELLFEKMKQVTPAAEDLELYEFRYCLDNLTPPGGWESVKLADPKDIETLVNSRAFYDSIQFNRKVNGSIVLDGKIAQLAQMLFVGLVMGEYPLEWVRRHFYFDLRGFYFLHRTTYFTQQIQERFGGKPYRQFEPRQMAFERQQGVGYKEFKAANTEVDGLFIASAKKLVRSKTAPVLLAIAGGTAAGKTEIVARLRESFEQDGILTTSIELDNFLLDRDYREVHGIHTEGKPALHFELMKQALQNVTRGERIIIPRYNFIDGSSSHDLEGRLKPGGSPIAIEPAGVIFIEGNFPFLLEEIARLIAIKVVYLTDDPVRLKRKWKRDIDYRKKYDPNYFRNRFFKDQFIMAEIAYRPQLELCDLAVDTTGAALWATPETARILESA